MTLLKNRTFVTRVRQAVLKLVRAQIRELESVTDEESDNRMSSQLQNTNLDNDENDRSKDGVETSDVDEEEEEQGEEDEPFRLPKFKLNSHDIFDSLWEKLPTYYESYKIKIDFEKGYLYIRTVPGVIHSKATTAFQYTIMHWARNAGTLSATTLSPLENFSDTSMPPLEKTIANLVRCRPLIQISRPVL